MAKQRTYNERKIARHTGLLLPMGIAMLALIGFQGWWLHDNFKQERSTLITRTNLLFSETTRQVQDSLIESRLNIALRDTLTVVMADSGKRSPVRIKLRAPAAARPSAIVKILARSPILDSANDTPIKPAPGTDSPGQHQFVNVVRTSYKAGPDSAIHRFDAKAGGKSQGMSDITSITFDNSNGGKFTVQLDSLYTRRIPEEELRKAFAAELEKAKLALPFTLLQLPVLPPDTASNTITILAAGEAGGYKLQMDETTPFLLQRISGPIIFSILLVALTVFSFIILYRTLLKQYRLSAMKNELISNITHELKTPISTVGVAIEALRNFNAINDQQKTEEYLHMSQMELQRLGLLVDKVLQLSMFEDKRININPEWIALDQLIAEVTGSLKLQFDKYRVSLQVESSGDLSVKADRLHLQGVIFNLLDNALKYGRPDTVIHVVAAGDERGVELRVQDEGLGIPSAYRDRVFDKFFRVPYGDTHNAKGHGLGLSYVAQVIERHRGTIQVESEEGRGCEFIIRLPRDNSTNV